MRALLLFGLAMCAYAQTEMRNTVTISGGLAQNAGNSCCGESAPALGLTYARRLFPHLELEAGVQTALSLGSEARGAHYDFIADDRFIWVPFGLKGVLPLHHDRVEVWASGGGTYEKYRVGNPADSVGFVSRDGWGGYASAGASIALDGRRHFWLGGSPRFFFANTNQGYAHDRWVILSAGLGFRW